MAHFAGVKHNHICVVSNNVFENKEMEIVEIPSELTHLSAKELITSCIVKNGKIKSKLIKKTAKEMKIALIGNYGTKCGIGTYSKFLYNELIKYIGDYRLFIEKQDKYDIENLSISNDKVIACWKRGELLSNLIKEIKDYDPDIIVLQHEFGLFPNAAYWLSMLTQLSEYRIIVTMHSVFHHKDKTIIEAAIPEIVVHLQGAKQVLKEEKGVPGIVHVIPHGCFPCSNKERLWNFYKSNHTIIQAGFLFKYKNWEMALQTIALLKNKYSDVFFTGLCSESEYSKIEHQIYYNELIQLIDKLGIQENVALIRGYQSDQSWDSYFRTNKIALFPYMSPIEHEVWGASGVARIAMSKNIPVISSSANHFQDTPTIKADTPEQIADQIDRLFSNSSLIEEQLNKQNIFLEENSWENVAKKYIKIFEQ